MKTISISTLAFFNLAPAVVTAFTSPENIFGRGAACIDGSTFCTDDFNIGQCNQNVITSHACSDGFEPGQVVNCVSYALNSASCTGAPTTSPTTSTSTGATPTGKVCIDGSIFCTDDFNIGQCNNNVITSHACSDGFEPGQVVNCVSYALNSASCTGAPTTTSTGGTSTPTSGVCVDGSTICAPDGKNIVQCRNNIFHSSVCGGAGCISYATNQASCASTSATISGITTPAGGATTTITGIGASPTGAAPGSGPGFNATSPSSGSPPTNSGAPFAIGAAASLHSWTGAVMVAVAAGVAGGALAL